MPRGSHDRLHRVAESDTGRRPRRRGPEGHDKGGSAMTQHERQLREAFESHEHMTPDPAAVYARVQELSRTYRMRRRGAQIAGGAVLGAGLIAGGLVVPGVFGPQGTPGVSAGIPAAAPASA